MGARGGSQKKSRKERRQGTGKEMQDRGKRERETKNTGGPNTRGSFESREQSSVPLQHRQPQYVTAGIVVPCAVAFRASPAVDLPKATSSCLFDMSKRPADEPAAVRSSQRPRVAPGWRREGGAAELVAGPSHLVPSLRSRARALLTDAPCA